MRGRGIIGAGLVGFGAAVVVLGATARIYRLAWRPPVYEPRATITPSGALRTWAEHDAIRASQPEPYILEVEEPGALLYFGTGHTRDPASAFVRRITDRWESFRPTVALCEGRTRFFFFGLDSGVRQFGEPAALLWLARRDGVPLYSLEPSYEGEVEQMLERWPARHVAAYYTLRVFWGEKPGHDPTSFDDLAHTLLRKRTNTAQLRGSIGSVADLDALWRGWYPAGPDWRTLESEPPASILAEMADASREIRARHMVRALTDLCRRGERVFAVVGSGHVIRQEPMILATLHAE